MTGKYEIPSIREGLKVEHPACAEVDPGLFFPKRSDSSTVKKAREICYGCVELEPCRNFALKHPEIQHGVWGGLSNREIRTLRARMNRVKNAK